MSVEDGRRLFENRGRHRPTITELATAKDYAGLGERGGLGRGVLRRMAEDGDRDAKTALAKLDTSEI